ncbi:MAG: acyltransferase [Chitinophagaceae bacterium]
MLNTFERKLYKIIPKFILRKVIPKIPKYHFFKGTANTQTPVSFDMWYNQFVNGHCSDAYWPVHFASIVSNPQNIYCGIETSPGYSPGNYIQAFGKIYIGDYTQIAPNVGIITGNHDLYDNSKHIIKNVTIGKYCWIGMGAIILPGVELGDYTIVAAGSIVTKSFNEGYCVIGGNPAKLIKSLDKNNCVFHKSTNEYNGYIKHEDFEKFRLSNLKV